VRLIARLDVKGPNLIKGIHLEGLRVVGDPHEHARRYYEQGIDEILYIDSVASLYGRNNLSDIVDRTTCDIFIPITVGGGVRSVEDVRRLLRVGADKIAVNTAAVACPELITEAAEAFGSQCVVVSIAAKRRARGSAGWEVLVETGRERTGLDAVEWAHRAAELGAGELLVTSVDREGTRMGFDVELTQAIARAVDVPVIASGGAGRLEDVAEVIEDGGADAVALASILHFGTAEIGTIKDFLAGRGIGGRPARRDS